VVHVRSVVQRSQEVLQIADVVVKIDDWTCFDLLTAFRLGHGEHVCEDRRLGREDAAVDAKQLVLCAQDDRTVGEPKVWTALRHHRGSTDV
jgi:hypothetical protein